MWRGSVYEFFGNKQTMNCSLKTLLSDAVSHDSQPLMNQSVARSIYYLLGNRIRGGLFCGHSDFSTTLDARASPNPPGAARQRPRHAKWIKSDGCTAPRYRGRARTPAARAGSCRQYLSPGAQLSTCRSSLRAGEASEPAESE